MEFSITQHLNGLVGFSKTQTELLVNILNLKSGSEEKYFYPLACELEKEIAGVSVNI